MGTDAVDTDSERSGFHASRGSLLDHLQQDPPASSDRVHRGGNRHHQRLGRLRVQHGDRGCPVGHRPGHADVLHRSGDQPEQDPQAGAVRHTDRPCPAPDNDGRRDIRWIPPRIRHGPVHLSWSDPVWFEHSGCTGRPEEPEGTGRGPQGEPHPDPDHGGHRPGDHPIDHHTHHGHARPVHRHQQPDRDDREHPRVRRCCPSTSACPWPSGRSSWG